MFSASSRYEFARLDLDPLVGSALADEVDAGAPAMPGIRQPERSLVADDLEEVLAGEREAGVEVGR